MMQFFKISKISIYALLCFFYIASAYSAQDELLDLSVEDLLNIEVISVAKKAKSLNDTPAAIFVISQDDINRIGATSIPEALRLAPGINVARIDANKWAVSARGFNSRFSNKLLVLIDGRNTYTHTFAGTYWENQDVMLEDVERIEVTRGSGATLWGSNAVNGVINIITKHSADTQGGLLIAGAGSEERGFGALRYGGKLNTKTTARAYVKGFNRDENTTELGNGAEDNWGKVQSGFRIDSQVTQSDAVTFQGDAYYSNINQSTVYPQLEAPYSIIINDPIKSYGGNLLVRQQHTFSSTSEYSLQVFYDFYFRDEPFLNQSQHTLDIDFQHRFTWLGWNDIVWGMGYRYDHNSLENNNIVSITPPVRNDQLFNAFLQDEMTLVDNQLWLTIGSKIEHNDYTGFEAQPTIRLMWAPHHKHRVWGAISRAVRTPSRLESDIETVTKVTPPQPPFIPTIVAVIEGNKQFGSENLLSYELGYRTTFIDNVSIDLSAFYNVYNNLRSGDTGLPYFKDTYLEIPIHLANNFSAQTYGFEISTVWQMLNWWRWDINYSFLKMKYGSALASDQLGISPPHRVSLRSALSPWENIDLDVLFRYVDSYKLLSFLGTKTIDDYVSLDIRVAWRPIKKLELSLVGQNLLAAHHLEYLQEIHAQTPIELDRGVYAKLAWHF
ncbi:MAG: iron complex outermembrane recepter protein [Methyloprofundus sp.]|nr:MAG: iron complex outermembrane recepter protein [Methyloprofundus sp.]